MGQSRRRSFCPALALIIGSVCLAQSNVCAQVTGLVERRVLSDQTLRLGFKGDFTKALDLIAVAQKEAEKHSDKASLAMATIDSAVIFFFQGEYFKALMTAGKVPPLSEIEHDKKALAHVLSRRAFLGYYRKSHAQALEDATRSLSMLDPSSDRIEIVFTLNVLGLNHGAMGDSEQSRKCFEESLKICRSLEDEFWLALPLNNLGNIYHSQNDEATALDYYLQSLAINERFGIRSLLRYTLGNIGNAYLYQGDHVKAMEYFQRSLVERETNGSKDEISTTLKDIGLVYRDQGDYPKAREYYSKSLAIEEAVGNKSRIAGRLSTIGESYLHQFNLDLALEYFRKSLKAAEAAGDKESVARAFFHMGQVYLTQYNLDLALDHFKMGLLAAEASGHRILTGAILQAMGSASREKHDYAQSLDYLQKSLNAYKSSPYRVGVYLDIGYLYYQQGDYDRALDYYRDCLDLAGEMGGSDVIFSTHVQVANTYCARANYAEAFKAIDRAHEQTVQEGHPDRLYSLHLTAARAHRGVGEMDKARNAYRKAIEAAEGGRGLVVGDEQDRQRFFERRVTATYEMVALLVTENETNEALTYAERAKARALLDVLQNGKVNITKAMTPAEQLQERQLKESLISLNSQITRESMREHPDQSRLAEFSSRLQKARLENEAFQTTLYAAHSDLRVRRGEGKPLTIDEAGGLIQDAKTALVEYVVTDDKTYVFVITRRADTGTAKVGAKVYSIDIKRNDLAARVEAFRQQLASRDISFRRFARELYDLLLKPAQADLQGVTRMVIVPDGALWELPFQALQPQANRYLIEDAAISYTPSLSVLREMIRLRKHQSGKSPTLLAFGNPALTTEAGARTTASRRDEKLEPLPEAEKEVRALQALYGAANSRILTGADAREDTAKAEAGKVDVLHIATHGILNNLSPMYSRVVLSQGNSNEDGLLEAWEIMKLDLSAEIVVLSACETARGRVSAGEGMIGLTWAFFVAGTPTTVVSQWKVDAAATSELMVDFHRNLRKQISATDASMTRAGSLRAAGLKMLQSERYKHPFYWAGFIVVGDGF